MRSITLTVQEGRDNRTVSAYEDESGKLYHDKDGKQPVQPGEIVTEGYSSSGAGFGTYDYATGKHSAEEDEE